MTKYENKWKDFIQEACWDGYERVKGTEEGEPGSCKKITEEEVEDIKNLEKIVREEFNAVLDEGDFFANMRAKQERCKGKPKTGDCAEDRPTTMERYNRRR